MPACLICLPASFASLPVSLACLSHSSAHLTRLPAVPSPFPSMCIALSVMLNWEMEFKKWCPAFKLITYYGTAKERKEKRKGWSKPNSFHVCITSYTLVLQDAKVSE